MSDTFPNARENRLAARFWAALGFVFLVFIAKANAFVPAPTSSTTTVFFVTDQRQSSQWEKYGFEDERYEFDISDCASHGTPTPGKQPFSEDCTLSYGIAQWDAQGCRHFLVMPREQFFHLIGQPEKALMFVHGFNERFEDAVNDGRYLANSLDLAAHVQSKVPLIVYGWPARAATYSRLTFPTQYMNDDANNSWTRLHLQAFIKQLQSHSPKTCLSFAAHSMGNQIALETLLSIRDQATYYTGISNCALPGQRLPIVAHLISIEPDVDTQTYAEDINELRGTVGDVTVYGNDSDGALFLSAHLHGHCRAGLIFCEPLYDGETRGDGMPLWLNIIDARLIAFVCDKSFGHTYYLDERVRAHIASLVVDNSGFLKMQTSPPPYMHYSATYDGKPMPHYWMDKDNCD